MLPYNKLTTNSLIEHFHCEVIFGFGCLDFFGSGCLNFSPNIGFGCLGFWPIFGLQEKSGGQGRVQRSFAKLKNINLYWSGADSFEIF